MYNIKKFDMDKKLNKNQVLIKNFKWKKVETFK